MKRIKLDIQKFAVSVSITGTDGNVSIANNTSYISGNISISTSGSTYNTGGTAYYTVNGGSKNYFSIGQNSTVSFNYTKGPYTHNADGSLGNQTITVYVSITSSTSTTGSISVPMKKINRYATVTSAPNFNDEENPTIKYSNPAGNSVSQLKACISLTGARDDIPYRDISKTGTSYTFELTEEERNTLRSATTTSNSRNVMFFVRTVIGGQTFNKYMTKTFTIINGNPVFSDFEFEDVNPTTLALTGNSSINVNGYSNVKATISTINKATAVKQATMSKYQFRIGNGTPIDIAYSDSASVNGTINNASSGVYNVFAVDSRGNTTLVTKLASAEKNYQDISINTSSKVERNNGGVGTGAVLTYSGTIWNESFGQVSNAIQSATYEFKKTSDSTWITGTTNITPTVSGNTFSFTGTVRSNNPDYSFNINYSYDFRITITDKLSTKTIKLTPMASAVPNISLADDGVGIMCDYDESLGGLLQIGGEVYGDITDAYTLSEVKTNQTWLGKPLYRRTYKIQNFTVPSNGEYTYTNTIANLDVAMFDKSHTFLVRSNGRYMTGIGASNNASYWFDARCITGTGDLLFMIGSSIASGATIYATVLYTKTTD